MWKNEKQSPCTQVYLLKSWSMIVCCLHDAFCATTRCTSAWALRGPIVEIEASHHVPNTFAITHEHMHLSKQQSNSTASGSSTSATVQASQCPCRRVNHFQLVVTWEKNNSERPCKHVIKQYSLQRIEKMQELAWSRAVYWPELTRILD